ncbi:hypothetical protein HY636_01830 [Candidatus Woesearchaeota archaeon]|nr:hypothetical protein [Candidatus Woesearchaeota archaeon]
MKYPAKIRFKRRDLIFIAFVVIVLFGAVISSFVLENKIDLTGFARKMLPAYSSYNSQHKATDSEKKYTKSNTFINDKQTGISNYNKNTFEADKEKRRALDKFNRNELLEKSNKEKEKKKKQEIKEQICAVLKEEASKKISTNNLFSKVCVNPLNNNLKVASGAFGYWINTYDKPQKEECLVEYDTCKEEGLPYLYEAYCDSVTELPTLSPNLIDCRDMFGDENYVCIKGACVMKKCGDGLVNVIDGVEEECDDGNNIAGDGCDEECKTEVVVEVESSNVDLVIGKINEIALSENCINSFVFEICNYGEDTVTKDFNINVEANGKSSTFSYNSKEQTIEAGECVNVKNPQKMSIQQFGQLGDTYEVIFSIDVDNNIAEIDEDNNIKSQEIYFGDNYYSKPNDVSEENICDNWCFDTDNGKDYWNKGTANWLYIGMSNNMEDTCETGNFDNKVFLWEQYCISPIFQLDSGLYVYPHGEKKVDCTVMDAKCEDGKCVPIEENNLNCKDLEGGQDAFTYGEVDYTSIDGKKMLLKDECIDYQYVKEYYCKDDELVNVKEYDCFSEKGVCINGKCVELSEPPDEQPDNKDGSKTEDTENDPFVAGSEDFCSWNYYKLIEYSLDQNNNLYSTEIDCTQYTNEFGVALCANAVCTYPNPSLKSCEEEGDNGLDYYNLGDIDSVNEYGMKDYAYDYCVEDTSESDNVEQNTNLLVEFYCNGNELKMTEPYDCSQESMVCHYGKCVNVDESQKFCEVIDDEENGETTINYVNEFGDDMWYNEFECSESKEVFDSAYMNKYIAEISCNENNLAYIINECAEGKVCQDGECIKIEELELSTSKT